MCWGTPAIVLEVEKEKMIARVDFGDGVVRDAVIGINEERVEKGDIVLVHAGVVISRLTKEGVEEQMKFFKDLLGDEGREITKIYELLLELSRSLKGERNE